MNIATIITLITSITSSVIAGCIMLRINRRAKKEDERDAAREKETYLMLKNLKAQGGVLVKIATCVKNDRVNGDMEAALKYQSDMKHELENFLDEQAVKLNH